MREKMFKILCASFLMFAFSTAAIAEHADSLGLKGKSFIIQSATELGKSSNGFWDVPGTPGKTKGNLQGQRGEFQPLQMCVWAREAGDPDDRRFSIYPGNVDGSYYFVFSKFMGTGIFWTVGIEGAGPKVVAKLGMDEFQPKYVGSNKWKIYYKGQVISLDGGNLVLKADHAGADTEWVFFNVATNQSYAPPVQKQAPVSDEENKKKMINSISSSCQFFQIATLAVFASANANNDLQAYLKNQDKASEQWPAIQNIVKAARQNKNIDARREILKVLSEVELLNGSGFIENALKGTFKNNIIKEANSEKDADSKNYINEIVNKFY